MNIKEKLDLIKRNTAEIVTEAELITLLKEKKNPSVYLGTAITGKPHVGYFMWVLKMADFLKTGFRVKVLLSDITGALDNTPWDILDKRYEYYKTIIPLMFEAIGVNTKKLEFVKSSDINLSKKYFLDLLKLSTLASVHDAKKAGSEVVKESANPKLSGLIYPLVQALDEQYLDADIQYGGIDQRKILMFAREYLPKLNYKPRIEFMTPIIPGLIGEKMSASSEESKIDLLDDTETIKKKMNKAYCPEGEVENNGVLAFAKYIIFTIKNDKSQSLTIKRPAKFGGNVTYKTYEQLEKDFIAKKLHPMDLKTAISDEINKLLEPIRKKMKGKEKIINEAFN
tara:strand:- start:2262 stop:3281 length:1020 start_codon:yes stop_codon:yes gene_type:complete